MNLHFVGIGGIGISGLAQFCVGRGDQVTGSEMQETGILPILRKQNIEIGIPQRAENIPGKTDLLIYSEAVPEQNPERIEAARRGLPQKSYFEFLGDIAKGFKTIAVAGTHGKTTTCGLIASGMRATKFDATFFVGSTLREFKGSNFHKGKNKWMVVEACEYRENFRFLYPEIVVLTSVEWDHPDAFPSEKKYFEAFENFIAQSKTVFFHSDDAGAKRVVKNFSGKIIPVSPSPRLKLNIYGDHNQRNARLALALAEELKLNRDTFLQGLSAFTGAGRRQEQRGEKKGIQIFDDYGHHPTEIRVTIEAFRQQFPKSKIGLIFEPHQFSRTRQFFNEFVQALKQADMIGIYPIYDARDSDEDRAAVSTEKLANAVGAKIIYTTKDAEESIFSKLKKGDIVVFMGAGKISEFARSCIKERKE